MWYILFMSIISLHCLFGSMHTKCRNSINCLSLLFFTVRCSESMLAVVIKKNCPLCSISYPFEAVFLSWYDLWVVVWFIFCILYLSLFIWSFWKTRSCCQCFVFNCRYILESMFLHLTLVCVCGFYFLTVVMQCNLPGTNSFKENLC